MTESWRGIVGPWQDEPDTLDFEAYALPCRVRRQSFGHLCGYVGVPKTHGLYGSSYADVDLEVHGGLTFSQKWVGEGDEFWWFGFDCAHSSDVIPEWVSRGLYSSSHYSCYRTIAYVERQTRELAQQLSTENGYVWEK